MTKDRPLFQVGDVLLHVEVRWAHGNNFDPVILYHELTEAGVEIRRVEVFADGRLGFADQFQPDAEVSLSQEPLPSLQEIASQPEFEVLEISSSDFEAIWKRAHLV